MTDLGTVAQRVVGSGADEVLGTSEHFVAGDRVEVYRNLHHGKGPLHYWSTRSTHAPRRVLGVIAHIVLADAELRVQRGAWAKVLATGKRTVHAYAVGTLRAWDEDRSPPRPTDLVRFTYDVDRGPYFRLANPEAPAIVERSPLLWFDVEGAWMRWP